MKLVNTPNENETDLEKVYKYICDGRIYMARELLEQILGIVEPQDKEPA
jgi:hypothetical protein